MFPIRDNNPVQRTPHVTWFLIAANVVVFTVEMMLGLYDRSLQFRQFLYWFGAIPAEIVPRLLRPTEWFPWPMGTLFSSMFIHGGFMHLAGNMLFLYIFGDNVEDELGHWRFLLFYLLTGLAGSAIHIALGPDSGVPMVGASGAISGIMGAYILLYPRARVMTLVFFFFITIVEIPAYWFLAIWFGIQFMGGLNSIGSSGLGGVAFWAHVGGFMAGMGVIRLWIKYYGRSYIWWE